jgi:hypothetical protein
VYLGQVLVVQLLRLVHRGFGRGQQPRNNVSLNVLTFAAVMMNYIPVLASGSF